MKSEINVSRCITGSGWFRLGCSLGLALALALVLLLMPIAAGTTIAIPVPALPQMGTTSQSLAQWAATSWSLLSNRQSGEGIVLSLSLGATPVRATGGLTITKYVDSLIVDQGDLLTYTLVVTNETGFNLDGVIIVTDTVPANTSCGIFAESSDARWFWSQELCDQGTATWVFPGGDFFGRFSNNSVVELSYMVVVDEPLPDQSEIVNAALSYGVSAPGFTDLGALSVNTTVNAPKWQISKSVTPTPTVEAGGFLTYTISVLNQGHLEATGLYTITDVIPDDTTYVTSTPPATRVGNQLIWAFSDSLAVEASRELTYVVQVAEPLIDGLSIVNATYSVTGSNVYTGAVGVPVSTDVQAPVLNIVKIDYTDPIWPGGTLTYTLAYSNTGGADATSVVISDTIDGNTAFVTSSPLPSNVMGSTYYWDIGDLPAGDADTILITVSVTSPLPSGTLLTNTANVGSVEGYGAQDIEATTVLGNPELHLSKEANTDVVEPGDLITYTISYSNSGDAPAIDVHITDTIDANTSFVASDPPHDSGNYVWEIGELWPADTHQITVTVRVTDSLPNGTLLTNDAIVWGAGNITDTDQAIVNVESSPILSVAKEASSSIIEAGDTLTYTIWYSNTGDAPATGVVISDTLPAQLHFQDAIPGISGSSGQELFWNLGTVNVGGPYSITLVATSDDTIPDNVQLTNQVTMSSTETGVTTTQETITVYAVDLVVEKIASPSTVKADESINYSITVRNDGHAVADSVRITDTLPTSIVQSSVIYSASPGVVFDGATPPIYVWATPNLDALSSITISISGRLVTAPWSASGDVFVNTVEVSSDDTEIDLLNNIDQEQATGRPGDPYTVTIIPALAETTVGTDVPVVATVTDQFGNPAYDGTIVSFSSAPIGSSVTPPHPTTSGGTANTTLSSLISATVTVTATAETATDSAEVIFRPGPLHHFAVDVASPQTAGIAFTTVVTALDQYGNVVDFDGPVTLEDDTGTLAPTGLSLVDGQGSILVTVYAAAPADMITATSGIINGVSSPFEVLPGDPDTITVTVNPTTIRVCETADVTATVTDQWGNPLPDQWVSLGQSSPLPPPFYVDIQPNSGFTDPVTGIFVSTLEGLQAGSVQILGTSGALSNFGSAPTVTVNEPAAPASLILNVTPNPLYTGGATAVVTATVNDCFGPSEGQTINFAVSDSSLAWLPGPSGTFIATTNANGVATVTLTSNSIPLDGTLTITGTVEGLVDAVTLDVELPPTPSLSITKTADPASGNVRPGHILNYTLLARNAGGVEATGVVISDTLPTGLGLVSRTTSKGTIISDTPLNVDVGSLMAGEAVTVDVEVTVTAEVSGTVLSNQASVGSNETELAYSQVVSHQVITGTGASVFLPIVIKGGDSTMPPAPTDANLRVTEIGFLGGAAPGEGQNYHLYVVVRNVGTEAVTDDFWVDLYLNPSGTPGLNQPWQELSQSGEQGVGNCPNDPTCYGRAWYVTSDLSPGAEINLNTQMPVDQRYDRWPTGGAPYSSRHSPMMALVDSWGTPSYGTVYENNETDNLSGGLTGAGVTESRGVLEVPVIPSSKADANRPTLPMP